MNQNPAAPAKRRFQLVRGHGARSRKEADQLDRFLFDTDPILIASLQKEEQTVRRTSRQRAWVLAAALGLGALAPLLWRAGLRHPAVAVGAAAEPAAKVAASDRERAQQLFEEGRRLTAEYRGDEALESFRRAVKLAPDFADAWIALGSGELGNYQAGAAEQAYRRALALEPGNPRALHALGNLYLRRGDQRTAEKIWVQGGLDMQLARLYLLQGRFREAEGRLAGLIAQSPEDETLYRMAKAARSRHLDHDLRCVLEPEPAGRTSWAELGWRLAKQKRHAEAADAFGKALARFPDDVNALSGMGSSLLALDRTAEARSYFERALALREDHFASLNGLANCLKNEGRVDEAISVWQRMAQLYPGFNPSIPGLAWTYYELRDYRQAAVYFARLIKTRPTDPRVIDALNIAVENISLTHSD